MYSQSKRLMAFKYILPGIVIDKLAIFLLPNVNNIDFVLFCKIQPSLKALVPTYSAAKCFRNGFSLKVVPKELIKWVHPRPQSKSILFEEYVLLYQKDSVSEKSVTERGGGFPSDQNV